MMRSPALRPSPKAIGLFVLVALLTVGGNLPARAATQMNPLAIVRAFEEALTGVIERSRPAIVAVSAKDVESPSPVRRLFSEDRIPFTRATGFFIRPDGYLLTNDHVVHGAQKVEVRLSDGRTLPATIVGTDPNTDIAVLKVDADERFPTLSLGNSDAVRIGEFVVSIGNPFRLDFSANIGIVSAKGRTDLQPWRGDLIRYQDFIQTDAYMNQGSSGGPLIDMDGDVIGINSLIRTAGSNEYSGLGFAIPSNIAGTISDQLIAQGRVVRGWLGVRFHMTDAGIALSQVLEGSPAARGGLRSGDVVTSIDGEPIQNEQDFRWRVAMTPVGSSIRFTVSRDGRPRDVAVVIGEMPARYAGETRRSYPLLARIGLGVETWSAELARLHRQSRDTPGVLVTSVEPESAAAKAGLRPADVILKMNDVKVATAEESEAVIRDLLLRNDKRLVVTVRSGNEEPRDIVIPTAALTAGGRVVPSEPESSDR